jgi:hypothetical protein
MTKAVRAFRVICARLGSLLARKRASEGALALSASSGMSDARSAANRVGIDQESGIRPKAKRRGHG